MKPGKTQAILAIIALFAIGLVVGIQMIKEENNFVPPRPSNVPTDAVWAGGMDGGCWALLKEAKALDQYQVTLYGETGNVWIRGNFWNSQHAVMSQQEIAQFDGGQLYLKNGAFLLPVGEQKRSFRDGTSITITYPEPSPEYTDARELTERLLDSSTVEQATP